MEKLLFVCSRNKRRSLTAEMVFRDNLDYDVKSCGTNNGARVKITIGLIGWADKIIFMEKRHKEIASFSFGDSLSKKQVHVLNIKDIYEFMDPKLVTKITQKMHELYFVV
ncbi:protein tyrosine phosphatase [Lacihabitans sp. LS3-19]|uniref:protein tyrosine phosphatase n=1 Tax=Lacihabitans sp. LS3-19 TaxID=2487335 RepID=UPI0020CDCE7E|nr:protein tyrosine phosphatase [Lacihabitans sp. LS3-19]MCP9770056.1 protein tyrosine phosphatase [Lacihabitans sp. LS3-19]